MARLRLNQGAAAVFYLPHFVAQGLGLFRGEGLDVAFVTSSYGKQWSVLERGEADLTIGGPMRTMHLQGQEGKRLVNFCAAVSANPWYLVGRQPEPGFTWSDLIGRTVIEFADAEPPGLCFRWLIEQRGVRPEQVRFVRGLGTQRELEAFRAGQADYLLHSLHTAAPLVATGQGVLVQELATPTGAVPWSAYAALPSTLRTRRGDLEAFTRAITRALLWIGAHPARELAALVGRSLPDFTQPVLTDAIQRYRTLGLWPRDPIIPRDDFEHLRAILLASGWLRWPVPYEDQVDTSFGTLAATALGLPEG